MEYFKIIKNDDEDNSLDIIILKEPTSAFQLEIETSFLYTTEIESEIKNGTCDISYSLGNTLETLEADIFSINIKKNSEGKLYAKIDICGYEADYIIAHAIILSIHYKIPIIITKSVSKLGYYGDNIEEKDFKKARTENLQKILQNALTKENYEKASKIRDEIDSRKGKIKNGT